MKRELHSIRRLIQRLYQRELPILRHQVLVLIIFPLAISHEHLRPFYMRRPAVGFEISLGDALVVEVSGQH